MEAKNGCRLIADVALESWPSRIEIQCHSGRLVSAFRLFLNRPHVMQPALRNVHAGGPLP